MPEPPQTLPGEPPVRENPAAPKAERRPPPRAAFFADLNVDPPPESDDEDCAIVSLPDSSARSSNDENIQLKNAVMINDCDMVEAEDIDHQYQGVSLSRDEKVSCLKAGLVHVARKMPKNAHAHYLLGLMYQRLGQPQKAVLALEKASEILLREGEEHSRPDLLSLVLIHHAQCILQANSGDNSDKELESGELEDILAKLKSSLQSDAKQAVIWNTLGLILLRNGRLQSAISILSAILNIIPLYLDSLANLGIAYLQSGNLELSSKCFQELILKDQHHPAAHVNYAASLLCQYGSIVPGPGANTVEGAKAHQVEAATVAKECLTAAVKADPKAGLLWVNLSSAYYLAGEHVNAKRCLEQAANLEPNQMAARYAIAVYRIKEIERSLDATHLSCAASEMTSILKEGDPAIIDFPIAWAGLAMAHRARHVIATSFETDHKDLVEMEERALCSLKQAIEEDPDDAVQWHQLGLHNLCTTQFEASVKFLKVAVTRQKDCCYTWSNLGISLQLSSDPSLAEEVYKRALSLATIQQAHAILNNLGNLYRQQKRFDHAKTIFVKCLELCPGYAPAHNNLGLVFVAEGQWDEARSCFEKALLSDPFLDAAKSNMMKAVNLSESKRNNTTIVS